MFENDGTLQNFPQKKWAMVKNLVGWVM